MKSLETPVHFSFKRCWVVSFFLIQILIEHSVNKQCKPYAAFCGLWSGSALFAYVSQKKKTLDLYGLTASLKWHILVKYRDQQMRLTYSYLSHMHENKTFNKLTR